MARHPDLSALSDASIILLVCTGPVDAPWAELDHRYRSRANQEARRVLGRDTPAAVTDEVAHDALTLAYLKIDRYDRDRPFWPWLSRLVHNCSIDYLRRRKQGFSTDLTAIEVNASPLDAIIETELRQETKRQLNEAMDNLTPRDRGIFEGFYINSASVMILARTQGLAENTVRGALSRGKRRIVDHLGIPGCTNAELKALCRAVYSLEREQKSPSRQGRVG